MRPSRSAVSSPSRRATHACAHSWTVSDSTITNRSSARSRMSSGFDRPDTGASLALLSARLAFPMGSAGNICAICGANYRADVLFCPQDGAPLGTTAPKSNDPLVGIELPGQIRIEKLIGVGAAGRVYRGFQGGVERPVAVKVLHAELSTDATVVARFHREARVASMLAHPHVI